MPGAAVGRIGPQPPALGPRLGAATALYFVNIGKCILTCCNKFVWKKHSNLHTIMHKLISDLALEIGNSTTSNSTNLNLHISKCGNWDTVETQSYLQLLFFCFNHYHARLRFPRKKNMFSFFWRVKQTKTVFFCFPTNKLSNMINGFTKQSNMTLEKTVVIKIQSTKT